jgi:hypothetical protein
VVVGEPPGAVPFGAAVELGVVVGVVVWALDNAGTPSTTPIAAPPARPAATASTATRFFISGLLDSVMCPA